MGSEMHIIALPTTPTNANDEIQCINHFIAKVNLDVLKMQVNPQSGVASLFHLSLGVP